MPALDEDRDGGEEVELVELARLGGGLDHPADHLLVRLGALRVEQRTQVVLETTGGVTCGEQPVEGAVKVEPDAEADGHLVHVLAVVERDAHHLGDHEQRERRGQELDDVDGSGSVSLDLVEHRADDLLDARPQPLDALRREELGR